MLAGGGLTARERERVCVCVCVCVLGEASRVSHPFFASRRGKIDVSMGIKFDCKWESQIVETFVPFTKGLGF